MKKSPSPGAASSSKPAKPAVKQAAKVKTKPAADAKTAKKSAPVVKTAARKALPAATPPSKGKESFFEEVFRLVRMVPKGRVTSYGDIANAAEARITARMVGWAMHAAGSAQPPVPAHRVVNSSGVLSGRQAFPTPTLMQELLEQEGVKVKNDKVQNFSKLRWAFPPAKSKDMPVIKGAK
ncbi:hypothetical protein DCC81_01535 [Chitinophaga parva]|uniref:Methylated-DNA-[protein]-cysteine S-methyltransferase DNA binding domain-containing protein n=1 Tax=Chitinophaga parva TaxID=2169414 RepID=A0A2T7BKN9_9BACT|nr:MGMT family protein [Chitinophaga parva]PUZ28191.1 hypothetical protein DCC81_01535 [Chitinophaga parva]